MTYLIFTFFYADTCFDTEMALLFPAHSSENGPMPVPLPNPVSLPSGAPTPNTPTIHNSTSHHPTQGIPQPPVGPPAPSQPALSQASIASLASQLAIKSNVNSVDHHTHNNCVSPPSSVSSRASPPASVGNTTPSPAQQMQAVMNGPVMNIKVNILAFILVISSSEYLFV